MTSTPHSERHQSPTPHRANFEHVQSRELNEIDASRAARDVSVPVDLNSGFQSGLIGLALSGGGIRSATFGLGVLQHLAELDMLRHIDILSMVSGGSYIGSWLTSWIRNSNLTDVSAALRPDHGEEAEEITFLRQHSNYLSPRLSLLSADTWLIATIWMRNMLLNLLILVAAFGSLFLMTRLLGCGWAGLQTTAKSEGLLVALPAYFFLALVIGKVSTSLWRVSTVALKLGGISQWQTSDEESQILPFVGIELLSAVCFTVWLCFNPEMFNGSFLSPGNIGNFVLLTLGFLTIQIGSRFHQCYLKKRPDEKHARLSVWLWDLIPPIVSSAVTTVLFRAIAELAKNISVDQQPWTYLTWGPSLVMTMFAGGVTLHTGLMGRDLPDAAREWLSRFRAWTIIVSAGWMAVVGGTFYGPLIALLLVSNFAAAWAAFVAWTGISISGLFAAYSSKTNGKAADSSSGHPKSITGLDLLARIAPFVFLVGFLILICFAFHLLLANRLPVDPAPTSNSYSAPPVKDAGVQWFERRYWKHVGHTQLWISSKTPASLNEETLPGMWFLSGLVPLLLISLISLWLLSYRVDINAFSMYYFYKNRLVRCYLGASRGKRRKPNPFTGFDDSDDEKLNHFRAPPKPGPSKSDRHERGYEGPYPILNATLNVTSGGPLQYQERKGISFVFTPISRVSGPIRRTRKCVSVAPRRSIQTN